MFKFLRKLLGRGTTFSPDFHSTGRIYHLLDPLNYSLKRCLFISAEVTTSQSVLTLTNLEYTGEQEDLPSLTLPIHIDMVLTRYLLEDEGERVYGFKFNNLNEEYRETLAVVSVEFEREELAEEFAVAMAVILHAQSGEKTEFTLADIYRYVEVEEEKVTQEKRMDSGDRARMVKTTIALKSREIEESKRVEQEDSDEDERLEGLISTQRLVDEVSHLYTEDQILYISPAELREYLPAQDTFSLTLPSSLFLLTRHLPVDSPHLFSLDIIEHSQLVMRTLISSTFQYQVLPKDHRFTWTHEAEDNIQCWAAILHNDISPLTALLARIIFDVVNNESISQVYSEEEAEFLLDIDTNSIENRVNSAEFAVQRKISTPEIDEFAQLAGNFLVLVHKNSSLSVLSDTLTPNLTLSEVNSLHGDPLKPHNLLTSEDNLTFLAKNSVHFLNFERQKVVKEWNSPEIPIEKICFSDELSKNELIGVNSKAIFTIDPRTASKKPVLMKKYAGKQAFSCIKSVNSGGICAGTQKGEVKLFREVGKNAKTSFPGLGKAIKSVDVTEDGRWVCATTEGCLLLLEVFSEVGNGFNCRLIKKERKKTRKLTLLPCDIARYQVEKVDFTPATFNRGGEKPETVILTSTGRLVVMWDFEAIKATGEGGYQLFPLDEPLSQAEFRSGKHSEIVTAGTQSLSLQVLS